MPCRYVLLPEGKNHWTCLRHRARAVLLHYQDPIVRLSFLNARLLLCLQCSSSTDSANAASLVLASSHLPMSHHRRHPTQTQPPQRRPRLRGPCILALHIARLSFSVTQSLPRPPTMLSLTTIWHCLRIGKSRLLLPPAQSHTSSATRKRAGQSAFTPLLSFRNFRNGDWGGC